MSGNKRNKSQYEAPKVIPLGELAKGEGPSCGNGGTASDCSTGSRAANNCNAGTRAASRCQWGTTPGRCTAGFGATARCRFGWGGQW